MRAPVLAMGDGALGFWSALGEVFPESAPAVLVPQIANVLSALPKSAHPGAKKALAEAWNAEDKDHARAAATAVEDAYGAKFPRLSPRSSTTSSSCSRSTTTRPSTGSTYAPRTRSSRPSRPCGPDQGHQGTGLECRRIATAFRLIQAAQHRWRAVNAPHLVALVRAGATFDKGKLVEREAPDHYSEATKPVTEAA